MNSKVNIYNMKPGDEVEYSYYGEVKTAKYISIRQVSVRPYPEEIMTDNGIIYCGPNGVTTNYNYHQSFIISVNGVKVG